MPVGMIKRRTQIIHYTALGYNNSEIHRITGYSRDLIRNVRNQISQGNVFDQCKRIGRPTVQTQELANKIESITNSNRRISTNSIVNIIKDNQNLPSVSYGTVWKMRHQLGFKYLPPIETFFVTDEQRQKRVQFCTHHLQNSTNWRNVLFTDESAFYLNNDHRWVWRRKGEGSVAEVQHRCTKYTKKVMMYGGICYNWKTPLICIEGNIDSVVYCDDCIDGTGLIPQMNQIYGYRGWKLLQDGATCHTSSLTMDYLQDYVDLVENWPPNSPDLNVIENLWSIVKRRVEEIQPQSIQELIQTVFEIWEAIPDDLIRKLIDSMDDRMQKVVRLNGFPNGY